MKTVEAIEDAAGQAVENLSAILQEQGLDLWSDYDHEDRLQMFDDYFICAGGSVEDIAAGRKEAVKTYGL